MHRIFGTIFIILALWIGVEAIITGDTALWGTIGRVGGGASYTISGHTALIMGVGWLFAAAAIASGWVWPKALDKLKFHRLIPVICLMVFTTCFTYAAGETALRMIFPGL